MRKTTEKYTPVPTLLMMAQAVSFNLKYSNRCLNMTRRRTSWARAWAVVVVECKDAEREYFCHNSIGR